jgi:XTP/dITP diphosphohydrolase
LVAYPDGSERWAEGVCEGMIAESERGERGFGYDAVFVPRDGDGRTFGEMTVEAKHELGHRGRAFRALAAVLRAD